MTFRPDESCVSLSPYEPKKALLALKDHFSDLFRAHRFPDLEFFPSIARTAAVRFLFSPLVSSDFFSGSPLILTL